MYTRNVTVNENVYTFVCDSRSTRNGFAHDCTLMRNSYEVSNATCHYLNRTWEMYRYQSVMKQAIRNLIREEGDNLKMAFKAERGYKNMTDKRKLEFANYILDDGNEKAKTLNEYNDVDYIVTNIE